MGRLDGKVALITGAGGGMGRVAAELFAREGARVTVVDVAEQPEVVAAIEQEGGAAITVAADVTDSAAVQAAVDATVDAFGGLHVLYNNAGVSLGDDDDPTNTPESTWD
ncbi:MAG: dehydrogenase, short-chain alcohol dehydrogenase like, partial [Acidimicrobiales bacterium]|nr:dehydrogenase, short-chain alcohol dehydrogenase like [Acidimicrobiales bacterium]